MIHYLIDGRFYLRLRGVYTRNTLLLERFITHPFHDGE